MVLRGTKHRKGPHRATLDLAKKATFKFTEFTVTDSSNASGSAGISEHRLLP